jgi:hypothetical protein
MHHLEVLGVNAKCASLMLALGKFRDGNVCQSKKYDMNKLITISR